MGRDTRRGRLAREQREKTEGEDSRRAKKESGAGQTAGHGNREQQGRTTEGKQDWIALREAGRTAAGNIRAGQQGRTAGQDSREGGQRLWRKWPGNRYATAHTKTPFLTAAPAVTLASISCCCCCFTCPYLASV